MRKLVILIFVCFFSITGCKYKKLDSVDLGKNIKLLLDTDTKNIYNIYYDGYKYFIPSGLKFVTKDEYNAILLDEFNNKYYMYVDAIAYFHKKNVNYDIEDDIHYSKKLNFNNKKGYIRIEEKENKFFIQFVFNYAKMEALVDEDDLVEVINNMCFVLRSIKFNDSILESLIGENILSYKEENFVLFDNKESSNEIILGTNDFYNSDKKNSFVDEDFKFDDNRNSIFDD